MRKLIPSLAGVSFLVCGAALHYVPPRASTVQIVGVEVKRVDGGSGSRDVYLIQTRRAARVSPPGGPMGGSGPVEDASSDWISKSRTTGSGGDKDA